MASIPKIAPVEIIFFPFFYFKVQKYLLSLDSRYFCQTFCLTQGISFVFNQGIFVINKTNVHIFVYIYVIMRTVLIIGAGRSASSLIQYLLNKSVEEDLHLIIGDLSLASAQCKTNNHPNATAISLDVFDENQRKEAIQKADIVISMLPAHLHNEVAKDCIVYKKTFGYGFLCE